MQFTCHGLADCTDKPFPLDAIVLLLQCLFIVVTLAREVAGAQGSGPLVRATFTILLSHALMMSGSGAAAATVSTFWGKGAEIAVTLVSYFTFARAGFD
jgi:hypothetical protein